MFDNIFEVIERWRKYRDGEKLSLRKQNGYNKNKMR